MREDWRKDSQSLAYIKDGVGKQGRNRLDWILGEG